MSILAELVGGPCDGAMLLIDNRKKHPAVLRIGDGIVHVYHLVKVDHRTGKYRYKRAEKEEEWLKQLN